MGLFVGLLIGLIIGAATVYWLLQKTISTQERELKHSKRALEEMEHAHEQRLKDTVRSLQIDYQRQLTENLQGLTAQYEERLRAVPPPAAEPPATTATPPDEVEIESVAAVIPSAVEPAPTVEDSSVAEPLPEPVAAVVPEPTPVPVTETPVPERVIPSAADQLALLGTLRNSAAIPQTLIWVNDPDPQVRALVATTIGRLLGNGSATAAVQRAIPVLGQLSRDRAPDVRQAAVQTLGQLAVPQVIPLLEQALRDTDQRVVYAASQAIARFKGHPVRPTPKALPAKKPSR